MGNKNVKELRAQVRNVTQELLPELLQSEVFKDLYSRLQNEMLIKLTEIELNIKTVLGQIDDRSKNVQTFIMNQIQAAMVEAPKTPMESGQETIVGE